MCLKSPSRNGLDFLNQFCNSDILDGEAPWEVEVNIVRPMVAAADPIYQKAAMWTRSGTAALCHSNAGETTGMVFPYAKLM